MAGFERAMPEGSSPSGGLRDQTGADGAEFSELRDRRCALRQRRGNAWTVDLPGRPAFAPSCLNRVVRVQGGDGPADVAGWFVRQSPSAEVGWP